MSYKHITVIQPVHSRINVTKKEMTGVVEASNIILSSLGSLLRSGPDKIVRDRLDKQLMYILETDESNTFGNRNVENGKLFKLRSFDFFNGRNFGNILFILPHSAIDREKGSATITIQGFYPKKNTHIPKSATHFKISTAALEVDFKSCQSIISIKQSPLVAMDHSFVKKIVHKHTIPSKSPHSLLLVGSLEFFQVMNGFSYHLAGGRALTILDVNGPPT